MDSNSSVSAYLTTDYEGVSKTFSEVTQLPSRGHCDLFRAKRYGRWYLLKCLKTELAEQPVYQQMLRKEFEVMMRLQHPAIIQATGIEEVILGGGKKICIVAEWIDGETLDQYLATNPPQSERHRLVIELAETLDYIHAAQIVHRDLKPQNIMVTRNGHYLKLIDFGLADTFSHSILKQPAGTMRYMSPEQATMAQPDVRNDIYSFGILLSDFSLRGSIFNKVEARCLAPIDRRYQNVDELLSDLRGTGHRRRWLWLLATVLALALIALMVGGKIADLSEKATLLEEHTAQLNLRLKVLNHEIIGFSDPHAKARCVALWDTDGDGELSYVEAAAVKSLDQAFTGDTLLRAFPELEHFTGLDAISANAFHGCSHLEELRLPRTIRYLRQNALRQTALPLIVIPSSVAAIGDHVLDDCPQLETVVFESVLPNTNDGVVPLQNCPRLSAIFVPDYWMSPDNAKNAWHQLSHLVHRHIPFEDAAVKKLCVAHWDRDGDHELSIFEAMQVNDLGAVFSGNHQIERFPELRYFTGLSEISASCFERCKRLSVVSLPRSIKAIQQNAFLDCDLRSVFIPASVSFIASTAISACPRLSEVVVSLDNPCYDSREHCNAIIDSRTQQMVSASTTATIPRSVHSLSDECFNWFNREELVLPAQITHLGLWSLTSCFGRVYCESTVPPVFNSQDGSAYLFPPGFMGFPEPEIYVPIGSIQAYAEAEGWQLFAHRLREYPATKQLEPIWTNPVSWKICTFVPKYRED